MLTLKNIIENRRAVVEGLQKKHFAEAEKVIDEIIDLDKERRNTQKELDTALAEQNKIAKQIGALIGQGKRSEAEAAKEHTARYKEQSKLLGDKLNEYEKMLRDKLLQVPNLPHESVPEGRRAMAAGPGGGPPHDHDEVTFITFVDEWPLVLVEAPHCGCGVSGVQG